MSRLAFSASGLRAMAGYLAFAGAAGYGLLQAPPETWQLRPPWLALATCLAVVLLGLQTLHARLFIRYHQGPTEWLWLVRFTARKGVLNTVMPAKTGTLILLRMLTERYAGVRWHDYVRYMLLGMVVALLVSLVAFTALFLPSKASTLVWLLLVGAGLLASRLDIAYFRCLPPLLLLSACIYLVLIGSIWAVLLGMGYEVTLAQSARMGIALNTLAQISITPGNLGVRELILGLISHHVQVSLPAGILSGAIFFIVRLLVFAAALAISDWLWVAGKARRAAGERI